MQLQCVRPLREKLKEVESEWGRGTAERTFLKTQVWVWSDGGNEGREVCGQKTRCAFWPMSGFLLS